MHWGIILIIEGHFDNKHITSDISIVTVIVNCWRTNNVSFMMCVSDMSPCHISYAWLQRFVIYRTEIETHKENIRTRASTMSLFCILHIFNKMCVQNYWVFGLFPSSGILGNRANLQWLRLALSKRPNWVGVFLSHLKTEKDPVSET
jgi:hypothetical protein